MKIFSAIDCRLLFAVVFWIGCPPASLATENGTTAFPDGAEDFLVAAMPPPGWYGMVYFDRYSADRLTDGDGNMAVHRFDLKVNVGAFRVDWIKPVSLLGADRWGSLIFVPVIDLSLNLSPVPGVALHGSKRGLSDVTVGNGLHWTFSQFEMVNAVDVVFPVGDYDASALVNPGQNRWVVRLNHIGTWRPAPDWEISYRLHWDYNFTNPDTDYHSGQTVYLNWAAGWKPSPPLTIGLAGYFLRQVSDDTQGGHSVGPDGNRSSVDGIGPCVKYFFPNHVMLTAKYFHEFAAENHPQGNQLWVYVALPLGPGPKK